MIALFLVWKLGSVLGRRTGHERPHNDTFVGSEKRREPTDAASNQDKVVTLPGRQGPELVPDTVSAKDEPGVAQGMTQIRIADPSFEPTGCAANETGILPHISVASISGLAFSMASEQNGPVGLLSAVFDVPVFDCSLRQF